MTSKEIIEGNRLVFDFLGCIHSKDPDIEKWEMEELKFHKSWDQVMRIWIKFRDLDLDSEKYFEWLSGLTWYLYSSNEPIRFFERLVYAIKWYNSTNPKDNTNE